MASPATNTDDCTTEGPEPVYLDLATESDDPAVTLIEALCMNCFEKGTTRLLLTLIPHYREVMVSSFSCPHCHHSNSSLLNTGSVQDKGVRLALTVCTQADLRRMIVKSDHATVKIPEVELEVPSGAEKGEITNVEGIISKVCDGLRMYQDARRAQNPEMADQIDAFVTRLSGLIELNEPFTIEINDPTGNSHIERLGANGLNDAQITTRHYERPAKLNEALGMSQPAEDEEKPASLEQVTEEDEEQDDSNESPSKSVQTTDKSTEDRQNDEESNDNDEDEAINVREEVMQFHSLCEQCHKPADTNMKLVDIPHFKEVVVMGTTCSNCGHRTSEVKSGGGISSTGRRITLRIDEFQLDMARDVLKSDTCSVELPEFDLHVGAGVLGGKFTTIEGLLINIKEDMAKNPFFVGDSVEQSRKDTVQAIFDKIDQVLSGELLTTLVLDDPAGNSYLQNVYAPDPDPNMTVEDYQRTFEQNEELGLNDMKTEGYEQD